MFPNRESRYGRRTPFHEGQQYPIQTVLTEEQQRNRNVPVGLNLDRQPEIRPRNNPSE